MKKTLFLLAALAMATAGTATAQTTPKAKAATQKKAAHEADNMALELGLANDQKARIAQILQARSQEMSTLKVKGQDTHKDEQLLKERYDSQLRETMTAAQFAKYQQLHAK